jgi:predicted restriction endonuclease
MEYSYDVESEDPNYFKKVHEETTREIENRPYQNKLRKYALKKYGKCIISGVKEEMRLDCAHIKPNNECDNIEKCYLENVLLLTHNIHSYFDKYMISINTQ